VGDLGAVRGADGSGIPEGNGDSRRVGAVHVSHDDGIDLEDLARRRSVRNERVLAGVGKAHKSSLGRNRCNADNVRCSHISLRRP